jgi:ABC-type dipeptide/oligopeptide/nickel transport system ATPase subunit
MMLLDVRGLSVNFGRRTALSNASFSLAEGEVLGVVGESGSGKTTLARAIAGLQTFQQGEITLAGAALNPASAMRDFVGQASVLQMVFQDPQASLNPRRTVFESVAEGLLLAAKRPDVDSGDIAQRVLKMLQAVGLSAAMAQRYPHQFSGGQRQRIAIARALVMQPKLLICDEAVSALDVSVQAQILNLLQALQREQGFSLLFIAHDLAVVRYLSDSVLVMRQGEIVEQGRCEEVFAAPRHAYTRQLIAAQPGG